ncbi:hypothetical protein L228DRAFT_265557 [Xylona heveae TC161]|uniref:Rhodopsin domain-containing protein n=1 Tax=Xylona heveae (strain CBS 132557 / TC161) TaxID=1328760 RepID=A0A165ILM7_XYLHT|nr:hypothetical protein L228DRAFT_265557 [Xylona heveae TC161]KZF25073.1 hypothetical protein L228DRAFT_265557 [Xylona heveae TC161]
MLTRRFATAPPPARTPLQDNPTLLFSWWCTAFALVIILVRIAGRYVRTEKLFREDKTIALSIIPLLLRMGLVHAMLRLGTNNAVTTGLTPEDIYHRSIGSRLVLCSRIMYAAYLWIAKFTVSEFLKRLTAPIWKRSYEIILNIIRHFLIISFIAVVISTLAECQPFSHYWQVIPDPGPRCRQGYAQLITMGACDVITDLLLVFFPIPLIIKSAMPLKRKMSLVLLFSLSLVLVAITLYRIPAIIQTRSSQQFRTVMASVEILAAAGVTNGLVLGSFVRDRGVKKIKYKFGSTSDSMERASTRRGTVTTQHWGSDEDLVRDLGIRLHPELRASVQSPRPAPMAIPLASTAKAVTPAIDQNWEFPADDASSDSDADLKHPDALDPPRSPGTQSRPPNARKTSFFDVGGLLEDGNGVIARPEPALTTSNSPSPRNTSIAQDHAQPRQGSRALLHDIGGLLTPPSETGRGRSRSRGRGLTPYLSRTGHSRDHLSSGGAGARAGPASSSSPILAMARGAISPPAARPTDSSRAPSMGISNLQLARTRTEHSLQDVGGLLNDSLSPSSQTSQRSSLPAVEIPLKEFPQPGS